MKINISNFSPELYIKLAIWNDSTRDCSSKKCYFLPKLSYIILYTLASA